MVHYDIPKQLLPEKQLTHEICPPQKLGISPEVILNGLPRLLHTDVLEQPDHLLIRMNLPGVKPENVAVTLMNNVLSVVARLETESLEAQYLWRERPSGEVFRSIALIGDLEMCGGRAFLEHGVLTVRVNKVNSHVLAVQLGALEHDYLELVQTDFCQAWY